MRNRLLLALFACLLLPATARAEPSCAVCHPDVKTEYAASVHARDLDCTGCHGGDASVVGMDAHSDAHGFIGTPTRKEIPALCASCHADPERMKPYGLPTDQYAQYQTSGHGRHLQGDPRVAVCSDCHGAHRILSAREPTSPVARANIAATCGRCHSDAALMAEYDMPADQEDEFRHSVHGKALLVDEHPRAPTCATCHGAHGAIAGGRGTIATVCGHCHPRTREYFGDSPHHAAAAAGKMFECASCHGTHAIDKPNDALFDTACAECHEPDSGAFSTGEKLKTLLSRAEESLALTERDMAELRTTFPTVVRYRSRLRQARAHLMEALTVQHSFSVERVDDLTRTARSISEEVRSSLHGIGQHRTIRTAGLTLVWIYLFCTVAVAILYRREKRRERRRTSVPAGPEEPPTLNDDG